MSIERTIAWGSAVEIDANAGSIKRQVENLGETFEGLAAIEATDAQSAR